MLFAMPGVKPIEGIYPMPLSEADAIGRISASVLRRMFEGPRAAQYGYA